MPEWTGAFAGAGLYPDIPEDAYHRDVVPEGSLSVSGAKVLIEDGGPAKYDYQRRHGGKSTKAMDLGTTVHGLVLGNGPEIAVLDFPNYTTKAAKEARDEWLRLGSVPMLAKDYLEAEAIAQAVLNHDVAGGLFAPGEFDPEVSMYWRDDEFGIWCRGRMDAHTLIDTTPTVGDLKTADDASKDGFAKAVERYRYDMQDVHYRTGLAACLGCDPEDCDFIFAVVETHPPYLVATYRTTWWRDMGRDSLRIAREKYRDCTDAGIWPGYSQDIEDLEVPRYARTRIERTISDYFD